MGSALAMLGSAIVVIGAKRMAQGHLHLVLTAIRLSKG
jgi:hypothetical protein